MANFPSVHHTTLLMTSSSSSNELRFEEILRFPLGATFQGSKSSRKTLRILTKYSRTYSSESSQALHYSIHVRTFSRQISRRHDSGNYPRLPLSADQRIPDCEKSQLTQMTPDFEYQFASTQPHQVVSRSNTLFVNKAGLVKADDSLVEGPCVAPAPANTVKSDASSTEIPNRGFETGRNSSKNQGILIP